jgi:hypothetical protein
MDFKEMGCEIVERIEVAQDGIQLRALVKNASWMYGVSFGSLFSLLSIQSI